MADHENIACDELRLLIERVEKLEEEERGLKEDKRDVYAEAKSRGYDVKAMREIVRLRREAGAFLAGNPPAEPRVNPRTAYANTARLLGEEA